MKRQLTTSESRRYRKSGARTISIRGLRPTGRVVHGLNPYMGMTAADHLAKSEAAKRAAQGDEEKLALRRRIAELEENATDTDPRIVGLENRVTRVEGRQSASQVSAKQAEARAAK